MPISVEFKNVSVKYGNKFRHNQNYHMVFWKLNDMVDSNTTEEDIKLICETKYADRLYFNHESKIKILTNTYT